MWNEEEENSGLSHRKFSV